MEQIYKKGDYIRKHSFELFAYDTFKGKMEYSPYEVIENISYRGAINHIFINKRSYDLNTPPVVITKEEAERLYKIWKFIGHNMSIGESKSKQFEHIREDNGQEKVGLTGFHARRILFRYSNLYPENNYELYKCSVCGKIHLGKWKEDE